MADKPKSQEDWLKEIEKVRETERLRSSEQEIGIIELRESLNDTKYELSSIKFALDEAAIVAITDIKGTITYVNKKFCEISKYTAKELIGQNHRIINSGYHPKEFFQEMYRTIAKKEIWKGQIKNKAKDGTYYWVDTTIVPLTNSDGKLVKYLAIRFDITPQKLQEERLKRDKERYEAIIQISEVFANVTTDNKEALDFTVRKLSEVLGGAIVVRVISDEENSLKVLAYHHKDEKLKELMTYMIPGISFPLEKGIYGEVIRTGKSVLIPATNSTEFIRKTEPPLLEFLDAFDVSSAVIVPLEVRDCVIGVVSLTHFTPGESYTEDELIYLQSIAQKIALGISNTELHKQNELEIERRKKSEEALLVYKKRYTELFNNNSLCIVHCRILTDENGKPVDFETLEVNDAYEKITGIAKNIVEGKRVREIVPNVEKFSFDYIGNFGKIALEGGELNFEILSEMTKRWYSYHVYSPKFGEFTLIFTDVTERKVTEQLLKENQARLLEAQRLAHIGSFSIELETGKVECTEELFRIYEIDPDVGAPPIEVVTTYFHPDERKKIAALIETGMKNNSTIKFEAKLLLPNGKIKYISYIARPVLDSQGKAVRRVGTIMDITDRKMAQIKLEESMAELERSNKELEQFAYVASHDLQEPLRMISNYVKLLSQRYGDRLDEKAKEYIKFAVDGAYRMNTLIKDLLTFSRITTKGQSFEQVDLNLILSEILQDLKFAIEEKKAEIRFGKMPIVLADKTQMWQLFKNLIVNGIKFNNSGKPIIVIKSEGLSSHWLFSVTDNGIGINSEHYERIFQIFQRLHERDKYPGTGIGLALCKKIVDRHGGRIWVESEEGHGSKFCFTLLKRSAY